MNWSEQDKITWEKPQKRLLFNHYQHRIETQIRLEMSIYVLVNSHYDSLFQSFGQYIYAVLKYLFPILYTDWNNFHFFYFFYNVILFIE